MGDRDALEGCGTVEAGHGPLGQEEEDAVALGEGDVGRDAEREGNGSCRVDLDLGVGVDAGIGVGSDLVGGDEHPEGPSLVWGEGGGDVPAEDGDGGGHAGLECPLELGSVPVHDVDTDVDVGHGVEAPELFGTERRVDVGEGAVGGVGS